MAPTPDMVLVCTYTCSAACHYVCDDFMRGRAVFSPIPDFGVATLATGAVMATAYVHQAASGESLVLHNRTGDTSTWATLGVRLVFGEAGAGAPTIDLGPAPPPAMGNVAISLGAHTVCDFDSVQLYRLSDGSTAAESVFANAGEGGTWLCDEKKFIDPSEPCGTSRYMDFSFNCQ